MFPHQPLGLAGLGLEHHVGEAAGLPGDPGRLARLIAVALDERGVLTVAIEVGRGAKMSLRVGAQRIEAVEVDEGKPLDLSVLVDRCIDSFHDHPKRQGLTILELVEPGLAISGDRARLQRAITAVVSNAINFNVPGGQVSVTTEVAGDRLVMNIADTGIGIDEACLKSIFDTFSRSQSSYVRSGNEGRGLGLAVAKSLIEQHGGQIEISSLRGAGTVVNISLPSSRIISRGAPIDIEIDQDEPNRIAVVPFRH